MALLTDLTDVTRLPIAQAAALGLGLTYLAVWYALPTSRSAAWRLGELGLAVLAWRGLRLLALGLGWLIGHNPVPHAPTWADVAAQAIVVVACWLGGELLRYLAARQLGKHPTPRYAPPA